MKYLLDVNALIAWGHVNSTLHIPFHKWILRAGTDSTRTCAISELGFIRVSMVSFGCTLADAEKMLVTIRSQTGGFIADCPPPKLARWSTTAAKTTDAYLCQLAAAHKLQLATFDNGIKDAAAFLIS